MTIDEIQKKSASAGAATRGYVLMMLVRPVAPFLAWAALRLGLTPRQVTYLGFALSWVIVGLAAAGGGSGRQAALLLLIAWELVDVADGTMARALGRRDNFGGFLDYAAGIVLVAFLPLALGIGLVAEPDGSLQRAAEAVGSGAKIPQTAVLVAAAGISAVALFIRLINRVLYLRFGDSFSNWDEPRKSIGDLAIRNLETLGGLQGLLLLIASFAGLLEITLVGYGAFYGLMLGAFMVSTHRNYRGREEYCEVAVHRRMP